MSFTWIPAGSGRNTYGGVTIYVKVKQRKGPFRETQHYNGFKLYLKDREVFVTRAGYKDYNHYTPIVGYDYCVDADLNGFNSAVGLNSLMITYSPKLGKRRIDLPKPKEPRWCVADSGGFQLLTGAELFIDPRDLAVFANKYCTRTMTLDIPPPRGCTTENLLRAAQIQRKNSEIILGILDPEVKLYNIAHGFSVESRRQYIDAVRDIPTDYWAMGTLYYGNTHDVIQNLMCALTYVEAKSYHVFGVGNTLLLPILAWIGKYFNVTADSSSHLQSGRASTVFSMSGDKFKKVNMGRARDEVFRSESMFSLLPCSCPICSALGTSEIYTNSNISNASHALAILHNINMLTRYSNIWDELAQTLTLEQYVAKLNKIIKPKEKYFWKEAIYFIENIMQMGLDKASDLNRSNLSLFNSNRQRGLFEAEEDHYDPNEYIEELIEVYEEWYKDNNIKFKLNTKAKKERQKKNKAKDMMGISTSSNKVASARKK